MNIMIQLFCSAPCTLGTHQISRGGRNSGCCIIVILPAQPQDLILLQFLLLLSSSSSFFLSCRRSRRILYCFSFFFFFFFLSCRRSRRILYCFSFFFRFLLSVNIAISPTAYMVRSCDSGIFMSLMTATKLMGLEIHLGSFGVTGVKKVNHVKNMKTALI